jgi:hypothetical protein
MVSSDDPAKKFQEELNKILLNAELPARGDDSDKDIVEKLALFYVQQGYAQDSEQFVYDDVLSFLSKAGGKRLAERLAPRVRSKFAWTAPKPK